MRKLTKLCPQKVKSRKQAYAKRRRIKDEMQTLGKHRKLKQPTTKEVVLTKIEIEIALYKRKLSKAYCLKKKAQKELIAANDPL
jgi:hypothetical protein